MKGRVEPSRALRCNRANPTACCCDHPAPLPRAQRARKQMAQPWCAATRAWATPQRTRFRPSLALRAAVLTRLLQPVLEKGGTMCMLACVHPGPAYVGETSAVLDYAKTTSSIVRKVMSDWRMDWLMDGLTGRLMATLMG